MKHRLIGISSHVYRLWSGFRAKQANVCWIPRLVSDCNFGGIPKRSAKQASLLDTLAWEEANRCDVPYFGAYVDCSKCFDTLKYNDLVRISRALGLSERILTPLHAWYRSNRRRVVVSGWTQPEFSPQRGIPQGCALSVTMAIVWSLTWSSRASQILQRGDPVHHSCITYLDDYSFGSTSLPHLQEVLGWTERHFAAWGVCLNLTKSSLLTNREEVQAEHGMQLLSAQQYPLWASRLVGQSKTRFFWIG